MSIPMNQYDDRTLRSHLRQSVLKQARFTDLIWETSDSVEVRRLESEVKEAQAIELRIREILRERHCG